MAIFKACDVRGVYGRELTDEIVYKIGRTLGTITGYNSVIVGGDVLLSTPMVKSAVIRGLTESGADVIDIGTVPTPAFYFARHHLGVDAGVMVTASHNPAEFNGLKIVLGSLPITREELLYIRQLTERGDFNKGAGNIYFIHILASYISFIQQSVTQVADAQKSNIVIDCGNGCYSELAPVIFRSFGYRVQELFCVPDGTFPNRSPNSAMAENLVVLCRSVRDNGANFGAAFDGDGDRVAFIDDRGRFLSSDKVITILAGKSLSSNPGAKVVYDLKCSSVVPETVARDGGMPIPERSGHTFIKTRMIAEDAAFGGEISGHYFYKALWGGDDGLYSALLMAGILASSGKRLSEIADSIPEYVTTPDIRVEFDGDREEIVAKLGEAYPEERISRLDGVKITFPKGWGLARVSVTEPAITLRFEAETEADLKEIVGEFTISAKEIRKDVEIATDRFLKSRSTTK